MFIYLCHIFHNVFKKNFYIKLQGKIITILQLRFCILKLFRTDISNIQMKMYLNVYLMYFSYNIYSKYIKNTLSCIKAFRNKI